MCNVYCGRKYSWIEEILHIEGIQLDKDWEDYSEEEQIFYILAYEDEYDKVKYWGCMNSMCYHCYGGT